MDKNIKYAKQLMGKNPLKKLVRKLASFCGYTCVPVRYPLWLNKAGTHATNIAALQESLTEETFYSGKAKVYNEVAQEITNFGKV